MNERMAAPSRHTVRVQNARSSEALDGERAKLFSRDASLYCDVGRLAKQNLAVLGLSAEPGRNITVSADHGVARAFGEPDLAERRIPLRDTDTKAQITTTLAPLGVNAPAASRIAIAILTLRSAGLGHGTGVIEKTP
jgi:hypothetical protein